jgi:methyl-accepting chemotaxis protein
MGIKFKLISIFLLIGIIPLLIVVTINYNNTKNGVQKNLDTAQEIINNELTKELKLIREIKKDTIETFFNLMKDQVVTLSENKMVIDATNEFQDSFFSYEKELKAKGINLNDRRRGLSNYYNNDFLSEYKSNNGDKLVDTSAILSQLSEGELLLQSTYISENTYPLGAKDNLVKTDDGTTYDKIHEKYHSIFKDYLKRFAYYDIFIVDSDSGNIIYSVYKELDYATSLKSGAFSDSGLGECYRKANSFDRSSGFTFTDLDNYRPSYESPAGFIGSPIFAGDKKIGVLIFQLPIDKINKLAEINQDLEVHANTTLIGPDKLLRSDISYSDSYTVGKVFRDKSLKIENTAVDEALAGKSGVTTIKNVAGNDSKVAYSPINILGVSWALLSEFEVSEINKEIDIMNQGAVAMNKELVNSTMMALLIAAIVITLIAWYFSRWISVPLSSASSNSEDINNSAKAVNVEITRIASSIDEMSNVIKEIAGNCDQAASASVDAVKVAEESEERINSLNIVSDEIASVLNIISRIAEKTDLLALNATIEAAAAGEAGRGFSVVANEVQNLANQTSTATKEITEKINEIQLRAKESSESILKIADSNRNIEDVTTTLASAIEELSLTISDINSSVSEVSGQTSQVTYGISEIAGEIASITKGSKKGDGKNSKSASEYTVLDGDDDHEGLKVVGG